jgi:transposase
MFARVNTVTQGSRRYQYLQILESYHDDGHCRHRLVANLGRVDQLGDKVDRLVASLSPYCQDPPVRVDDLHCQSALTWGPVLLGRFLWDQMQLDEALDQGGRSGHPRRAVSAAAFVLVAHRLSEPGSEHGLARWLEHTFVCDREGRRWEPDWLAAEKITKRQRVQVHSRQLSRWYRTLDALLAAKDEIEQHLYRRVRDLFHMKVDLVCYDLTSTYFCRRSPRGVLCRHGRGKDGKPRQVQVLVGVVMANGFPIAHHVLAGNASEKRTLPEVLEDLQSRFGIDHVMVVSDRGLVSPENLEFLSSHGFCYLLGIAGRRCRESAAVLDALSETGWEQVDQGNRVQEVRLPGVSCRYFVIDSTERKAYEEALRQRDMGRAQEELEAVSQAVARGRLKDPAKIGARAARVLGRHHGHRYYSWESAAPGQFRYFEDPVKLAAETRREGKYLLKTDRATITAAEAVGCYKQLNTVEQGFRDLQDVIEMRPIYHHKDDRVQAHIFVASLALFLKQVLAHQLAERLPELSVNEAFAALRSVGLSELRVDGQTLRLVSGGGRDARRVLTALGITQIDPPKATLCSAGQELKPDGKEGTRSPK